MKKRILSVLIVLILILVPFSVNASSSVLYSMDLDYNNYNLMRKGAVVNTNRKVMIPVKEFANAIGANAYLNREQLTYTISKGNTELVLNLNDNIVKLNGKYIWWPQGMQVIGQRLYAPATYTAKTFGLKTYINYSKNRYEIFNPVNGKIKYKVESGDTLYKIAQSYGTTLSRLMKENNLSNAYIYVGQSLKVANFYPQGNEFSAYVKSSATLESGPGFNYQDKNYLKAWTQITIKGKSGNWYYVSTLKGTGYLYKSVVWIKQESSFTDNSNYFNKKIGFSTSGDYTTWQKYYVKQGDTVWSVAQKFGIPKYELQKANNLSANSYLSIGQVLWIPVHHIAKKSVPGYKYGEVMDWDTQGRYILPIGKKAVLIDMDTGAGINIKRTIGATHSDTETLSWADTNTLKKVFGGSWTWKRKPFILEVDGRRFAVSVSAMPHAGVDGVPFLQNVNGRSGNYGYGPNYDSVNNGMDGHFDLFFLNSRRHKDGQIDPKHQRSVMVAGGLQ